MFVFLFIYIINVGYKINKRGKNKRINKLRITTITKTTNIDICFFVIKFHFIILYKK